MAGEVEPLEVPHFSIAERDQRWRRVREAMDRERLDVIVAPPHTGHHDHFSANARYLTGLGGFSLEIGAVFPLDGPVTAVTVPDVSPAHWRGRQDWVDDIRSQGREFGDCIAGRLRELKLRHGRIGIAGMEHIARVPDGLISHTMYEKIAASCPGSDIVDATLLLEHVRSVKSEEEIAFLRQGVALAEAAIDVMASEARPDVPQCAVYGRMVAAMVERGGEIPTMIMWNVGPAGWSQLGPLPTQRKLAPGDLLNAEIEGRWAGYVGQVTTTAYLGKVPAEAREMEQIALEALSLCWQALKPGATLGDLARLTQETAKGTRYNGRLIMHGRGLGDDAPLFTPSSGNDVGWVLQQNQVFMVKPQITTDDRRLSVTLGDSVVCTAAGAQRLGSRPVEIIEID